MRDTRRSDSQLEAFRERLFTAAYIAHNVESVAIATSEPTNECFTVTIDRTNSTGTRTISLAAIGDLPLLALAEILETDGAEQPKAQPGGRTATVSYRHGHTTSVGRSDGNDRTRQVVADHTMPGLRQRG